MITMLAQSSPMIEKLALIHPEIALFIGACIVMMLGLSPSRAVRDAAVPVAAISLIVSGVFAFFSPALDSHPFPQLMGYAKMLTAITGVLMIMLLSGTVDRALDRTVAAGRAAFEPIRTNRGEFYAFFLFSIMGLMLVATADDLIWLFLALELTSLPTYVMVSISSSRARAQEAGVKYFFLGAFGAAIFLYGFALLYGAAGTTQLFGPGSISDVLAENVATTGSIGTLATIGLILSIIGLCFKIGAVPMHAYVADVYQGAASSVSGMLAFVPKAAGIFALIAILSAVGWTFGPSADALPETVRIVLWVIAAMTMLVGNVLALLQSSVKRMLAYSSVSHSGYMLVGLIVGPAAVGEGALHNGIGATLFYLLCYAFMNVGTFATLAAVEHQGEEIETLDDLRGLCKTHPLLGYSMVLCSLSLLGLPPLLGFFGKLYLFVAGINAGEIILIIILGLTSAMAALYYLRLASQPFLGQAGEREQGFHLGESKLRVVTAVISAASVVLLLAVSSPLMTKAHEAGSLNADQSTVIDAAADRARLESAAEDLGG